MKQFVKFVWLTAFKCCLLVNFAFTQQIHGNFYHCCSGTFSVTCLKEPQLAFLNSKLHVLHVMIVVLKLFLQSIKLCIYFRHSFFH